MSFNTNESNVIPELSDVMMADAALSDDDRRIAAEFKAKWQEVKNSGDILAKGNLIAGLVKDLCKANGKDNVKVAIKEGSNPRFEALSGTVVLNEPLSILEALHETAHACFGPEEAKAYAWSVQLFAETFTKSFWDLVAKGKVLMRG